MFGLSFLINLRHLVFLPIIDRASSAAHDVMLVLIHDYQNNCLLCCGYQFHKWLFLIKDKVETRKHPCQFISCMLIIVLSIVNSQGNY